MSEFTPGPWHLFPSNNLCIESKSGNVALCNLARENYADARLISSAPELLEALECLLPGLVLDLRYADDDDDKDAMRSRIETVTSAIRKATQHT